MFVFACCVSQRESQKQLPSVAVQQINSTYEAHGFSLPRVGFRQDSSGQLPLSLENITARLIVMACWQNVPVLQNLCPALGVQTYAFLY